jgi:hypothetical protein
MERRPSGVTVLSATSVVAGILMLISGSILSFSAPIQMIPQYGITGMQIKLPPYLAASLIYDVGIIVFVLGVASIFTAYGLLKGDPWARKGMIIFTSAGIGILAIAVALFHVVEVANLIINGSILLYLFKPNVKRYFTKVPTPATS